LARSVDRTGSLPASGMAGEAGDRDFRLVLRRGELLILIEEKSGVVEVALDDAPLVAWLLVPLADFCGSGSNVGDGRNGKGDFGTENARDGRLLIALGLEGGGCS
jgi:hypothetical protein